MAIYATFNPADKYSGITLSNGNLTATKDTSSLWENVRSTIGVSSGKWYWEITPNTASSVENIIGVATSSASMANFFGYDIYGWTYYGSSGKSIYNSVQTTYGSTFTGGDVIGVALDMGAGTLTFYKNGVSQGQAFTGISGTVYAGISIDSSTANAMTANFGATAFAYTVPSGFNAGLYTFTQNSGFLPFFIN